MTNEAFLRQMLADQGVPAEALEQSVALQLQVQIRTTDVQIEALNAHREVLHVRLSELLEELSADDEDEQEDPS